MTAGLFQDRMQSHRTERISSQLEEGFREVVDSTPKNSADLIRDPFGGTRIAWQGIAIVDLSHKRAVSLPDGVPNNNGAFAPGIVAGDRLFVGGQLGRDPVRQLVPENPDEQVAIALCDP